MSQHDQLGVRALELLAEDWMVPVMRGLADGATRPMELEQRLPGIGHSMVMRRLRRLLERELVTCERQPGSPPHARHVGIPHQARYHLTNAGRMLLDVTVEAGHWEQIWSSRAERRGSGGALAINLSADCHTRKIMLLLADGPRASKSLDDRASDLCRSALRRRLRELVLAGLIERRKQAGVPLYELTAAARHLSCVAMLAGRWEWQWSRPERSAAGSDLSDLLHMLAPVARVPEAIAGICRLRVDTACARNPDIYVAACAGHVLALGGVPATPPTAVGRATPAAWCDALLSREGPITMSGNRALLTAVIAAFSAALVA